MGHKSTGMCSKYKGWVVEGMPQQHSSWIAAEMNHLTAAMLRVCTLLPWRCKKRRYSMEETGD